MTTTFIAWAATAAIMAAFALAATWNKATVGGRHLRYPHTLGNTSQTLLQAYLYAAWKMQGGPVGFGTDFNGFAGLPGPRFGPEACPGGSSGSAPTNPVGYPYTAFATGQAMNRSVVGRKTFDFNLDGLAHVGLLPDLIADFQAPLSPSTTRGLGSPIYLVLYRPGQGTMWMLKNTNGAFAPIFAEGAPGRGIGSYDLAHPSDRVFPFDFDHAGTLNHLFLYRPGYGTAWVLERSP
jgi:hypothetical protein